MNEEKFSIVFPMLVESVNGTMIADGCTVNSNFYMGGGGQRKTCCCDCHEKQ